MRLAKRLVERCLRAAGFELRRLTRYPSDFTPDEIAIVRSVREFTMTSEERIVSLIRAVDYLTRCGIPGAIVECGVWRGGSMLAVAKRLLQLESPARELYLFDTFEGMTAPTDRDRLPSGMSASDLLNHPSAKERTAYLCRAGLDDVEATFRQVDYPQERIHFVQGPVEETIPARAPKQISLLRLDTDWYESTRHELEHLFPCLVPGGVIIIDDYGHWEGARQAVDEYLQRRELVLLLNRIDYSGRIGVKSS